FSTLRHHTDTDCHYIRPRMRLACAGHGYRGRQQIAAAPGDLSTRGNEEKKRERRQLDSHMCSFLCIGLRDPSHAKVTVIQCAQYYSHLIMTVGKIEYITSIKHRFL